MAGSSYVSGTYLKAGSLVRDSFGYENETKYKNLTDKKKLCVDCTETNIIPKGCLINGCHPEDETILESDLTFREDVQSWLKYKGNKINWKDYYAKNYTKAKRNTK